MRQRTKRFIVFLVLFAIFASYCIFPALANDIDQQNEASIAGIEYATLEDAINNVANGETITLLQDVHPTKTLYFSGKENVTIDGMHTISFTEMENPIYTTAIVFDENSDIIFHDVVIEGNTNPDSEQLIYISKGKLTLSGDTEIKNHNSSGATINVAESGELILLDTANIHDCVSAHNNIIHTYGAVSIENDSRIEKCTTDEYGAVYVEQIGSFTMKDNSLITECKSNTISAVYSEGQFNMDGGIITGNEATGIVGTAAVMTNVNSSLASVGKNATVMNNTNGNYSLHSLLHVSDDLVGMIYLQDYVDLDDANEFGVFDNTFAGAEHIINENDLESYGIEDDGLLKWSSSVVNTFTVSFTDPIGFVAAPDTQMVESGMLAVNPGDLSYDGYVFTGWYEDIDLTIPHDFNTPVTSDILLFAGWTQDIPQTHTVSIVSEYGDVVSPVIVNDGEFLSISEPVSDSAIFTGWHLEDGSTFDTNVPITSDITLYASWEIPQRTYTVSFVSEYGIVPEPQIVNEGDLITRPEDLVKDTDENYTYQFLGWYTNLENEEPYNFATPVYNDVTLYAAWGILLVEHPYILTFDVKGACEVPTSVEVWPNIKTDIDLPTVSTEGYNFLGWYTDYDGQNAFDSNSEISSDMTLYAKWEEIPHDVYYRVTFDTNGHGVAPEIQTVKSGDLASMPSELSADNYEFTGWYSDVACTIYYNFSAPVYSDITVYAGWKEIYVEPIYYTVTFNNNGHGYSYSAQSVESGNIAVNPGNLYADGYEFKGWFADTDYQILYNFTTPVNSDITLYAKWGEIETKPTDIMRFVSFNNNGHGSVPAVQSVKDGSTAVEPTLSENGYTFLGWYTESNCINKYNFSTPVTSNITLYAGWIVESVSTHKVIFDNQGHGITPAFQNIKDGEKAVSPMTLEEDGYIFGGWYSDKSCTNEYDFSRSVNNDITLYAKWTPNLAEWVVVFNNNGRGTAIETQRVTSGSKVQEPAAPTVNGYTFTGWYTDSQCQTPYNFNNLVTTDLVLYAGWNENSTTPTPVYNTATGTWSNEGNNNIPVNMPSETVNVYFELQGHGANIASRTIQKGSTIISPENPYEAGYAFGGWYLERTCLTPFDFGQPITTDVVLYAKWIKSDVQDNDEHFIITFSTKYGISPDKQKVKANEKALKPTDPTDDSHEFTNWFSDEECTLIYNFNSAVTKDLTLYAGWKEKETKPNIYTVTFEVGEHGIAPDPIEVNKGDVVEKPTDPTVDGYVFGGWYKEEKLLNPYNFNRPVNDDIILYAKWTPGYQSTDAIYYVKFSTGEGASTIEQQSVKAGEHVVIPQNPILEGFDFAGWYTEESLINQYDFNTPVDKDFMLYAKWEEAIPEKTGTSPVVWILAGAGALGAAGGGFAVYKKKMYQR